MYLLFNTLTSSAQKLLKAGSFNMNVLDSYLYQKKIFIFSELTKGKQKKNFQQNIMSIYGNMWIKKLVNFTGLH